MAHPIPTPTTWAGTAMVRRVATVHRRRIGAAAALVALAGAAAACGSSAAASTGPSGCGSGAPKLTVTGSGQASATPDTLTITLGVSVSDSSASAALADANQRAASLTNSLKTTGVIPSDIQSTAFSINPNLSPSGAITGYQVDNTLVVTLHDLSKAGQAVDVAASSVGDAIRVNGLNFSVSDTSTMDGRARADAVATAASHARSMASAAGESLGGVCSMNDTTSVPFYGLAQAGAAGAPAGDQVPLEPGTQHADAQVTVVYAIARK